LVPPTKEAVTGEWVPVRLREMQSKESKVNEMVSEETEQRNWMIAGVVLGDFPGWYQKNP